MDRVWNGRKRARSQGDGCTFLRPSYLSYFIRMVSGSSRAFVAEFFEGKDLITNTSFGVGEVFGTLIHGGAIFGGCYVSRAMTADRCKCRLNDDKRMGRADVGFGSLFGRGTVLAVWLVKCSYFIFYEQLRPDFVNNSLFRCRRFVYVPSFALMFRTFLSTEYGSVLGVIDTLSTGCFL